MISKVTIKNYKSVVDISLPLGRFNLLIGANGCGKSNILEGIAMGAAASSDKLDFEFFSNRGIRLVEPKLMLPAFEEVKANKINISFINEKEDSFSFNIHYNSDSKPPKWEDDSISFQQFLSYVRKELNEEPHLSKLLQLVGRMEKDKGTDTVVNIRLRKNEGGG